MSSDLTPPVARAKSTNLHVGDAVPGVAKSDPIIVVDGVRRTFGGLTAVDVAGRSDPQRREMTVLAGHGLALSYPATVFLSR